MDAPTITFGLSEQEYVGSTMTTPCVIRGRRRMLIFGTIFALLAGFEFWQNLQSEVGVLFAFISLYFYSSLFTQKHMIAKLYRDSRRASLPITLSVMPSGVRAAQGGVSSDYDWNAVLALEENSAFLFVIVDTESRIAVPKSKTDAAWIATIKELYLAHTSSQH
jgi:hypothetical protein